MRSRFCLILLFILIPVIVFSQRQQKVGVVLSGGGAKGLAHIGVLRALEEENIPIDYICGTSMGAIIAGLYASGYSPDDMEKIFTSPDFENWLSGKIEDKYKFYYRQLDKDESLININLDTKNDFKAQIPLSLVNPVQMDYAFMEIFASSSKVCKGVFDSLMVPFFCVATNINDNKADVRRSGDLGSSIRASMTFPFVFSPIVLDGKTMCDGGIYNNFPSKEMQEYYNPDMIIGVKVAGNYDPPKEGDLKSYIENMITSDSQYDVLCDNSVLIEPNVRSLDVMDFTKKQECITLGYQATKEKIEKIRKFLVDSVSQEEMAQKRNDFNNRKGDITIGNVLIKGVNEKQRKYIENTLSLNNHKRDMTLSSIKPNYFILYSDPNIKSIQPYIYYDRFMSSYILDLNVKTRNYLTTKVGGCLSTGPISNMYIGLDYNFLNRFAWQYSVNAYLGRYYKSFMAKARTDFANNIMPFYTEIELNLNNWNYFKMKSGIFEYSPNNYIVQKENNIQLHIGMPLGIRDKLVFKFGIGQVNDDYFNNDIVTSLDTNDNTKFNHLVIGISREYNSLDNDQFPTSGIFSNFNVQYIKGKEKFTSGSLYSNVAFNEIYHNWMQFSLKNMFLIQASSKYSINFSSNIFYSFQNLFSTYKSSLLNAGIYSPTLETMTRFFPEYRSNQYLAFGVENIFKVNIYIFGKASARLGGYVFAPIRQIQTSQSNIPYYGPFFKKVYFIGSSSLVFSTPIGNISLILSYHQRDISTESPWSLSFNFGSMVFNKKNIDR